MAAEPTVVAGSSVSGYAVQLSLEEQRDFPGTTHIFVGVVERALPCRHVNTQGYEYTPVVVRPAKMIRGPWPSFDGFVLRTFGCDAAGPEQAPGELTSAPEVRVAGTRLVVFGPDPLVVRGDEPMRALTPNGLFVIEVDHLHDATHAVPPEQAHSSRLSIEAAEAALKTQLRTPS